MPDLVSYFRFHLIRSCNHFISDLSPQTQWEYNSQRQDRNNNVTSIYLWLHQKGRDLCSSAQTVGT